MDDYKVKEGDLITFNYTNWKGQIGMRKAIIKEFVFGSNGYHKDYQMMIVAFDVDKLEERIFAVKDMTMVEAIYI